MWFLGRLYDIRVSSKESGGRCTVMEFSIAPGAPIGSPPHIHHDADETVYVLEGTGRFHYDDKTVEAGVGTVLNFAKGTLEYFDNAGSGTLKLLVTYTPSGIDEFFSEAAEPAPARTLPPPPTSEPDLASLMETARKYGLEIRPPA
jgi:quercetin dioxygenase-like cupin family protein